ncbi:MAG: nucleoside triphosphate pyrophosphohydrolase, partial [Oxalobacteraceae bacterium]
LIEQCRRADTALLSALDMLIADIRIREGRRLENVED